MICNLYARKVLSLPTRASTEEATAPNVGFQGVTLGDLGRLPTVYDRQQRLGHFTNRTGVRTVVTYFAPPLGPENN